MKGVFLTDSTIKPNVALAEKGIFIARAFVSPTQQTVPVQIITSGKDTVKLYGGTNTGHLEYVEVNDPALSDFPEAKLGDEPRFDLLRTFIKRLQDSVCK